MIQGIHNKNMALTTLDEFKKLFQISDAGGGLVSVVDTQTGKYYKTSASSADSLIESQYINALRSKFTIDGFSPISNTAQTIEDALNSLNFNRAGAEEAKALLSGAGTGVGTGQDISTLTGTAESGPGFMQFQEARGLSLPQGVQSLQAPVSAQPFAVETGSIGPRGKPVRDIFIGQEHIKDPNDPRLAGINLETLPLRTAPAGFQSQFLPTRQAGQSIEEFTRGIDVETPAPTGPRPPIGTSAEARAKELGLPTRPQLLDLFTTQDQTRLTTAQTERAQIDEELATILNERLRLQEEFRKFEREQVGLPEAGRRGAISEEARQIQDQLEALSRREIVLNVKLTARNNVISTLMNARQQDYANAVAEYNREFTFAIQLYNIIQKERDELVTNAKSNLDVLIKAFGNQIVARQTTANDVRGAYGARIRELELQAGLPEGSTFELLKSQESSQAGFKYKGTIGSASAGYKALWINEATGETKLNPLMGPSGPKPGVTPISEDIDAFARSLNAGRITLSTIPSKLRGSVLAKAKEFAVEDMSEDILLGEGQGLTREELIDQLVPIYPEFSKEEIRNKVFELIPDRPQEQQEKQQGFLGGFFSRLFGR